jgi:hypothetical protein
VLHRAVRLSDDGAARPADLARLVPDREPEDSDPPAFRLDALPPSDLALDGRTQRLADDYEWFLQAIALGVIRRKLDAGDREAAFQPRGQYLFEVEPGSGEWLQIGNEYAIRSNGLPPYYREQVIAAVRRRLAAMGPHQLALLAALMRHYQQRVYEPKLEVDETGAQLPSPSLPNITARRLYDPGCGARWR